VDRPTDRDPPRWQFDEVPSRADAWGAMKAVLALMELDGLRVLKELSFQDP
jgi:hypothetical protein